MAKIDCDFTDDLVCPYCGHKHRDAYEHFTSSDDIDTYCDSCGLEFHSQRHITIHYTSTPVVQDAKDIDGTD